MNRDFYVRILTSFLASVFLMSCTTYDDDDEPGTDVPDVPPTTGKIGGEACTSNQECRTGLCTKGVCECSEFIDCIDGMYCAQNEFSNTCASKKSVNATCAFSEECSSGYCAENKKCKIKEPLNAECAFDEACSSGTCYKGVCKLGVGESCTSYEECASGLCDGRCMATCSSADECASNMICDSGLCHSIVKCPGNFEEDCFVTGMLTPNTTWVGGQFSENSLAEGDYMGSHYVPSFPQRDENFSLCITPMFSLLGVSLASTRMNFLYSLVNGEDKTQKYARTISEDHFGEIDKTTGLIKEDSFYFTTLEKNKDSDSKLLEGFEAEYNKQDSYRVPEGTTFTDDAYARIGEMFSEPRVRWRANNLGCLFLAVQQNKADPQLQLTFTSRSSTKSKRKLYLKARFSNSALMSRASHFYVSLAANKETELKPSLNNVLFPIGDSSSNYVSQLSDCRRRQNMYGCK